MLKSFFMKTIYQNIPAEARVVIIIFLVFFVIAYVTGSEKKERVYLHYLSTLEQGVYGASDFRTLASETGLQTKIHGQEFFKDISSDIGVIIVLCPEEPFSTNERLKITEWIQEGGTLVYGNDIGPMIMPSLGLASFFRGDFPVDELRPVTYRKHIDKDSSDEFPTYSENDIKVARVNPVAVDTSLSNIEEIHSPLFLYNESLNHVCYHPEIIEISSEDVNIFEGIRELPENEEEVSDVTNTEEELVNEEELTEGETQESEAPLSAWRTLAKEGEYPAVISRSFGQGKIIAVANPLIFSNGFIRAGDNILFAHNILSEAGEGKIVLFDEYRHGYRFGETRGITSTGWGRSVVFIMLLSILAIFSKAIRFIPPRAIPPPVRRSKVEYLQSMAQILRRAKALGTVMRIMRRDIKNLPADDNKVRHLKQDLENEFSSEKPSETRILSTLRDLIKIENYYSRGKRDI